MQSRICGCGELQIGYHVTDRFGLCVDITSIHNIQQRVEIVELRERFEAAPTGISRRVRCR